MLEKRIEQMKEGFKGILLNLLKFNRTAHKNLTLTLLLHNLIRSSFMNNKIRGQIIFWIFLRLLEAYVATFSYFTIV